MGQIIAIGGGGFGRNPNHLKIERYIIDQSLSDCPNVCFIPTASAENPDYIKNFNIAFHQLKCNTSILSLFSRTPDLEALIMSQDVIYVGGGNTKSMLAVFREWNLDTLIINAYKKGKILAGVSAGAICWFEKGITDSWAHGLRILDCMNLLKGVCCPHYDGEANRKPSVKRFLENKDIDNCLCIEDGAAVHYENEILKTAISFYNNKNAYQVKYQKDKLIESPLKKIDL